MELLLPSCPVCGLLRDVRLATVKQDAELEERLALYRQVLVLTLVFFIPHIWTVAKSCCFFHHNIPFLKTCFFMKPGFQPLFPLV